MKSALVLASPLVLAFSLAATSSALAGIYPDAPSAPRSRSSIESIVAENQASTVLRISGDAARDLYNLLATGSTNESTASGQVTGRGVDCYVTADASGHYPSSSGAVGYECQIKVGPHGVR